jgi:hypothetical protein
MTPLKVEVLVGCLRGDFPTESQIPRAALAEVRRLMLVRFYGNVFSDPLPSKGHGADHIENISFNTLLLRARISGVA